MATWREKLTQGLASKMYVVGVGVHPQHAGPDTPVVGSPALLLISKERVSF